VEQSGGRLTVETPRKSSSRTSNETVYPDRPGNLGTIVMNHFLLAGLFAAFVSTSAPAQPNPLDQTPSPTIVYCDLVTVGDAPAHLGQLQVPLT
jgi:hypothetical protein